MIALMDEVLISEDKQPRVQYKKPPLKRGGPSTMKNCQHTTYKLLSTVDCAKYFLEG